MSDEDQELEDSKPEKLSKDELDERRKRIASLRSRGASFKDIATAEGVSVGTVKRDLAIAQADGVREVKEFNKERYTAHMLGAYDNIYEACWKVHDTNLDPDVQLKALQAARQTLNDRRKAMVETSMIKKDTSIPGMHINLEIVAGMTEEEIRSFSEELIAKQALKTELLLPEPDEDILEAEIVSEPLEPESDEAHS